MIKAVIFDVDGVLLDSVDKLIDAYQEVGRRLGLKVPNKNFFRTRLGVPQEKNIQEAYGKSKRAVEFFRKIETNLKPPLKKDVKKILKEIKLAKSLVTTKRRESVKKQLKEILPYFKVIITVEDTEKHKPDPEPLLLACKKLGIYWEEAIYVGDMVRDHETAKNANMEFVGILGGASTKNEFRKCKVKYSIENLEKLPKILKKIIIRPRTVMCFLKYKNKILLLKRSSHVKYYQNKWNGISGYVKPLENPDVRARKEIIEETGIKEFKLIRKGKEVEIPDKKNKVIWVTTPYLFKVRSSYIKTDWENIKYIWVKPDEIKKYKTTPKLYETLKKVL